MFELVKSVAGFVGGAAAGVVAGDILRVFTPENLNKTQRIIRFVGRYAIIGVVTDVATQSIEKQFDDIKKSLSETKKQVDELTSEEK